MPQPGPSAGTCTTRPRHRSKGRTRPACRTGDADRRRGWCRRVRTSCRPAGACSTASVVPAQRRAAGVRILARRRVLAEVEAHVDHVECVHSATPFMRLSCWPPRPARYLLCQMARTDSQGSSEDVGRDRRDQSDDDAKLLRDGCSRVADRRCVRRFVSCVLRGRLVAKPSRARAEVTRWGTSWPAERTDAGLRGMLASEGRYPGLRGQLPGLSTARSFTVRPTPAARQRRSPWSRRGPPRTPSRRR